MKNYVFYLLSIFLLTSCEKMTDVMDIISDDYSNITFKVVQIEQIPFENTTRSVELSSLISRLSIAVFQGDTKIKVVNQTKTDASFGTVSMQLAPGTYQLVVIAHNGQGNCTISSPDKITFQNNKITDTFYYYGTYTVTESATKQLTLMRPVAMFRLKITEKIPTDVVQMKFYYTGGSSTFDAVKGYGCVNSRQTEIIDVSPADYGQTSQFEIYTFPHEENDFLNITVSALNKSGDVFTEKVFDNIYVQQNVITQHTTSFFQSGSTSETTATIDIYNDGQWNGTINQ